MSTPPTVRVAAPSPRAAWHYFLGEPGTVGRSLCDRWLLAPSCQAESLDAILAAPASSRAADCKACVAKARSLLAKGSAA